MNNNVDAPQSCLDPSDEGMTEKRVKLIYAKVRGSLLAVSSLSRHGGCLIATIKLSQTWPSWLIMATPHNHGNPK